MMVYLSEKCSIKFNDFPQNLVSFHQNLREDTYFSDVTLVGDGDLQIEAHRIILCASSPFFNTILKKNKHFHPIIYMRGLKAEVLSALIDIIYNGEASVYQEDLDRFIMIAEELQLKGMENCAYDSAHAAKDPKKIKPKKPKQQSLKVVKQEIDLQPELKIATTIRSSTMSFVDDDELLVSADITVEDLRIKLESLMKKVDNGENIWKCTVCGKKNGGRKNLRTHIETHLKGLSYPCNKCNTISKTSSTSRMHSKSH